MTSDPEGPDVDKGDGSSPGSSRRRFALALVGGGRMGKAHLSAIQMSSAVDVVAVVDPSAAIRQELATEGLATFGDLDELFTVGGVDGVLIAAPTDTHLEVVRRIAAAGLPILCEKPCGLSQAEAEECARVTTEAGVVLQVAYWRRFVPELAQIRQQIRAGAFGALLAVECHQWDATPPPAEFRDRSGGIFVDMGVHEFDQVRWLTGQEFDSLHVVSSGPGAGPGDPDCALLVAALDGGATASISLGRWYPGADNCKVDVFGTHTATSSWFLPPSGGDGSFRAALRLQAEDFARFATTGTGTGATVADAIVAFAVARRATDAIGRGLRR